MKLSIDELIAITGGNLAHPGLDDVQITGLAALDEAGRCDVSFLGNERYYKDYTETKAGAVLITDEVASEEGPEDSVALITVENPSMAFAKVVKHFFVHSRKFTPGIEEGAHVSKDVTLDPEKVCVRSGAVIQSGAVIGEGTEIGPGSVVGYDVNIGKDCVLHANVSIRERCHLGDRVILQPGCVIGSDGYGYEFVNGKHEKVDQVGIVVIENDVEIGANSTIDRARFGKTVIGEGTKVDNLVQIGHNVQTGKHCLVVAQSGLAGSCTLGDYVTLAAHVGVAGHIRIEDKATLTARTVAFKDLKGDMIYKGMPARPIQEEQKKLAHLSRLPKLSKQLKELARRVDELESG